MMKRFLRLFYAPGFLFLLVQFNTFAQTEKDSLTVSKTATIQKDSLHSKDSLISKENSSDTIDTINKIDTTTQKKAVSLKQGIDTLKTDSLFLPPGIFFGIGAGVSLGNFPLFKTWQRALPSQLDSFGLNANSFSLRPDTSIHDTTIKPDTAKLVYKIINKPNVYSMTFPVQLSIISLREKDRFTFSTSFALLYKELKASLYTLDDSVNNKIDLFNKLSLYTLSFDFCYGRKIPSQYFSINGVSRSDLILGFGVSPLAVRSTNKIETSADRSRIQNVRNSLESYFQDPTHIHNYTYYGAALSLKAGINAVRKLSSKNSLEVGLLYTFNWYNYFYDHKGTKNFDRVHTSEIEHGSDDSKPYKFSTNRLEIKFSLLRNNQRDPSIEKKE